MTFSPEEMVSPKAIAPYEAALAFKLWQERMIAEAGAQGLDNDPDADEITPMIVTSDIIGGLGPPWPMLGERPADFGERCALALFTLIKEI